MRYDAGMTNVPFLTPTPYTPPPHATPTSSSNDVKDLIDYLERQQGDRKAYLIDLFQSYGG